MIKVREDGQVRQVSALVATGINAAGYREILGLQLGNSESENIWGHFFGWLKDRGLQGVDFLVSDDHPGPGQSGPEAFSRSDIEYEAQIPGDGRLSSVGRCSGSGRESAGLSRTSPSPIPQGAPLRPTVAQGRDRMLCWWRLLQASRYRPVSSLFT